MSDQEKTFLGVGWSFPPTFHKGTKQLDMTNEQSNIDQCLSNLLGTLVGERLMIPDYGTQLNKLIFSPMGPELYNRIRNTISRAILNYEPRIKLLEVVITEADVVEGVINIQINYMIRKTNSRHNMVYPFYTLEGTNVRL